MSQEKIIIRDSSILDKMLGELQNEHKEAINRSSRADSLVNEEMAKLNKEVESIRADISKMPKDVLRSQDVLKIIEQVEASANAAVNKSISELKESNRELTKKIEELAQIVNKGGIMASTLDRKIEDIREEIKNLNTRKSPSADVMFDYTVKVTQAVVGFVNANKPNYSKFSQNTKNLFKSVLVKTESVKKRGPEVKNAVAKIISSAANAARVSTAPVSAGNKGNNSRKPENTQSAANDMPPGLDAFARKFCLGKNNSKQNLAVFAMISLLILFAIISYIMISGSYETMSLGTVKLFGSIWKLSTLLIAIDTVVLTIIIAVRVLATAYCLLLDRVHFDSTRIKAAVISIIFLVTLVIIGRSIKDNFYAASKDYLRFKDILLTENINDIGRNIKGIFELWRMN